MLRSLSRTLAVLAGAALLALPFASTASAALAPTAAAPSGACTDGQGVTVVVDSTELGGGVEVGCAPDAATGTEALTQAGFVDTRDDAGIICAISGLPDPCPATFEGQYWSYWYAQDGAWQAYMEGSDTAVPAAGGVEGWRWSDGATGPDVDLAALTTAGPGASAQPEATATEPAPTATEAVTSSESAAVEADGGVPLTLVLALVAVAAVGVAAVVVLRRRNG